jgi:hypothetical protein
MAEIIKFHEKNIALFGVLEGTSGTYQAPAAADVLAATTLSGSVTHETTALVYLGDSNSRNEYTFQKDVFADVSVETPQQVLGVLNVALTPTNAPLSDFMQACGAQVTVDGGTGNVLYTNTIMNPATVSIDYRKSSAQNLVNQKLIRFSGCKGMVDLTASVGDVPRLKFALKGNAQLPVQNSILTPDYVNQTTYISAPIRMTNIVSAQITPLGEPFTAQALIANATTITKAGAVATVTMPSAHGLLTGRLVNISGASDPLYNGDFAIAVSSSTVFTYTMAATPAANASGTLAIKAGGYAKNFCHATLTAANFFGRDLARYLTGCEEGFSSTAVPTDVAVTMLEPEASAFSISGITFVTTTATVTAPSHKVINGDYVTISGATGVDAAKYNGTYIASGVTANTFTYTMLSTPAGIAVTTSQLTGVNTYSTYFDPDAHVSEFFAVSLKFGTSAGRYVTYSWDKLQLANVKDGKVGSFLGRDVAFRNTGTSSILLS